MRKKQSEPPKSAGMTNVYRMYTPVNGEHLYTTDYNEVTTLSSNGWNYEGIGWEAPTSGDPVYRLYSPVTGAHLFTSDDNEKNTLASSGWSIDNNNQPLYYSGGSNPIYRLYHEGLRMSLLTLDENEYNTLGNNGWNKEGTKFYGTLPGQSSQSSPSNNNDNPETPSKPSNPTSGSDKKLESIILDPASLDLTVGESQYIYPTYYPEDFIINDYPVWTSSNPSIATVNDVGLVTGISKGNAVISFEREGYLY